LTASRFCAGLDGLGDAAALRRAAVAGAFACTRGVGRDGFIDRDTLDRRAVSLS
jgi:hypothetical protein